MRLCALVLRCRNIEWHVDGNIFVFATFHYIVRYTYMLRANFFVFLSRFMYTFRLHLYQHVIRHVLAVIHVCFLFYSWSHLKDQKDNDNNRIGKKIQLLTQPNHFTLGVYLGVSCLTFLLPPQRWCHQRCLYLARFDYLCFQLRFNQFQFDLQMLFHIANALGLFVFPLFIFLRLFPYFCFPFRSIFSPSI